MVRSTLPVFQIDLNDSLGYFGYKLAQKLVPVFRNIQEPVFVNNSLAEFGWNSNSMELKKALKWLYLA